MPTVQSRRRFVTNLAFAGAAGLGGVGAAGLGSGIKSFAAEPPPETTTIRFENDPVICIAPQVLQDLLRAEGFTDIRYIDQTEAHLRRADAVKIGCCCGHDCARRGRFR
jgi:NitT/TauT family transport system substrate-binding protein